MCSREGQHFLPNALVGMRKYVCVCACNGFVAAVRTVALMLLLLWQVLAACSVILSVRPGVATISTVITPAPPVAR